MNHPMSAAIDNFLHGLTTDNARAYNALNTPAEQRSFITSLLYENGAPQTGYTILRTAIMLDRLIAGLRISGEI